MSTEVTAVETVTLTIDGFEVSVPKGTLIIRAAEQLGIEVPRFCDHPLLEPVAACRACLVEIEGQPKPQPSCAIPVAEGMKVRTQHTSEIAELAQQGVMEFLLLNHPLDCPVCDKGGECPLQNQAMSAGRAESRFDGTKREFEKPINLSAQILLDRERCVSCARCTRFASEIAGEPLISLQQRGAKQVVGISDDQPFDSYLSGNTVQICPVGALTSAGYRFRARPFDLISVPTVCEHCSAGCAIRTDVRRGVVQRRLAWEDGAVNEEWNCDKGRFAFKYASEARLKLPLVRGEDGALHQTSWPQAIQAAAEGLAKARGGRSAVLAGGRHTLEDAYAIAKFARGVLGTDDIDFRARPHSAEEAAFLAAKVAGSGIGVTYAEVEKASRIVLICFDADDENPILNLRLRKAARRNRTRITAIASHATAALQRIKAEVVATKAGDEVAALAKVGVDADTIVLVGERAATVPGLFSALAASSARVAWVPRRAGERAAVEAGLLPGLLPGGRQVSDEAARNEVAGVWGVDTSVIPTSTGRDFNAIVNAATAGAYEALIVTGFDADDTENPDATLAALQAAPFVVALELSATPVTALADVVFPVAAVSEKAGAFVNWEGRNRPFGQALRETNKLTDARVLAMLADAMDTLFGRQDVAHLRAELAALGEHTGFRASAPAAAAASVEGVTLSTWPQLLDSGVMQAGEPFLAATAREPRAVVSPALASRIGVKEGDNVTVSTARGAITLPAAIVPGVDDSVWVPSNSYGSHVRTVLGAVHGSPVQISRGGAE